MIEIFHGFLQNYYLRKKPNELNENELRFPNRISVLVKKTKIVEQRYKLDYYNKFTHLRKGLNEGRGRT